MKIPFLVLSLVILMWAMVLVTPAGNRVTVGEEEKKLVVVQGVTVEKVKAGIFRVTAGGVVGSPGWVVNLEPLFYVAPPETWEIHAMGTLRPGVWPQVETPWKASIEMNLSEETRHVAVKGSNKTIKKPVPW